MRLIPLIVRDPVTTLPYLQHNLSLPSFGNHHELVQVVQKMRHLSVLQLHPHVLVQMRSLHQILQLLQRFLVQHFRQGQLHQQYWRHFLLQLVQVFAEREPDVVAHYPANLFVELGEFVHRLHRHVNQNVGMCERYPKLLQLDQS